MKILVFSDSHGAVEPMARAVNAQKPDAVFHLGDCVPDAHALHRQFPDLPLYAVAGNNDWGSDLPLTRCVTLEGVTFFLTHGHRHGVYQGCLRLSLAAREAGASVALYGHTHQQDCQQLEDGAWVLNPGACGRFHPTFGVIEIANGRVTCYNATV